MRRVEHLVAAARGELAQQAVQVTLRGRAQVELRLLDQDDEPAHARLDERGDRADEREPAVVAARRARRRPLASPACRSARAASSGGGWPGRRASCGAPSRFRLSVAGGRASRNSVRSPISASTCTRVCPCETSSPVGIGAAASSSVQIAERTVDLPGRRLADEHADLPGLEHDVARAAVAVDRDALDRATRAALPADACLQEEERGSRAARRGGASGTGTTRARTASRRAPCSRGARGRAAAAAARRRASGTRSGRGRCRARSAYAIACSISDSSCVAIAVWPAGVEHPLQQSRVRRVDVRLARVGDRLRLEVGALDEPEVRRERRAAPRGRPACGRGRPAAPCRRCRSPPRAAGGRCAASRRRTATAPCRCG